MAYCLKAGEPVPKAVRRIALEEIESAAAQLGHKDSRKRDDPIHEARKSAKKIRALLRLIRPELGTAFERENRRFRNLGRKLSTFRESAAAIETFDETVAKYPEELDKSVRIPIRRALIQHKRESERRGGIDKVAGVIAAAFRNTMDSITKWPLQHDGFAAIERGLAKTFRQGRKALDCVRKDPRAENYHDWRKRVKDHWYHIRLLADDSADSTRTHLKKLHRLETWLGEDHNLALLREKIAIKPDFYGPPQAVERFLHVSGQYQKKLREKALSLGGRIYEEGTSHFIGRMKDAWQARS